MDFLQTLFIDITGGDPYGALLIVLNLIIIESLLSIDNAAVLATMVMDLPTEKERKKALKIGLILAYVFRGTALVLAGYLMQINFLKLVGAGYLIYLSLSYFYKHFVQKKNLAQSAGVEITEEIKHPKKLPFLSLFWSIVLQVEIMDITFSLDNVFAAVAFTKNIYLVCTGVFIGIITMRIVAGYFVSLMEKFPFLESIAFFIVGLLGLKLCASYACHYFETSAFCILFENEKSDLVFSLLTVAIFLIPILYSILSKKHTAKK